MRNCYAAFFFAPAEADPPVARAFYELCRELVEPVQRGRVSIRLARVVLEGDHAATFRQRALRCTVPMVPGVG
jgi:hypothetical protein